MSETWHQTPDLESLRLQLNSREPFTNLFPYFETEPEKFPVPKIRSIFHFHCEIFKREKRL
jgi:hypothetical protein